MNRTNEIARLEGGTDNLTPEQLDDESWDEAVLVWNGMVARVSAPPVPLVENDAGGGKPGARARPRRLREAGVD